MNALTFLLSFQWAMTTVGVIVTATYGEVGNALAMILFMAAWTLVLLSARREREHGVE